jgi:hypothetical protein
MSCPSARRCVAVDSTGRAAICTGGRWPVVDIDPPSMAEGQPPLVSVSCPSRHLCVAVDQYDNVLTSTDATGGRRARHLIGPGSGGLNLPFDGLSCASSLCVADGDREVAAVACPTWLCLALGRGRRPRSAEQQQRSRRAPRALELMGNMGKK